MKSFNEYINESSLSRIYKHYCEHDSGTISAYRHENTREKNKELNKKLKAALLGAGFSVTEIDGVYIEGYGTPNAVEVKERSFVVVDINDTGKLKGMLKFLGEKYEQDSITFSIAPKNGKKESGKYYLIGTSKSNNYPEYHKEIVLGHPMFGEDGEFYSKVNGRPFIFSESALLEENNIHTIDDRIENYNNGSKYIIKKIFREETNNYIEQ